MGDPLVGFDWTESESPSAATVQAVAEAADDDPTTLPPLYHTIHPDPLDRLVDRPDGAASVAFEYLDYWVVVEADGEGYVYARRDRPPSGSGPVSGHR